MNKNLKVLTMLFVLICIVFSAGCTGNTQSTQNPNQGTPNQNNNQPQENGNVMPHHRLHMNGSGGHYWNNTSGRPHFNGSERFYWNNTTGRPHFNGSMRPFRNNSRDATGNITEQT